MRRLIPEYRNVDIHRDNAKPRMKLQHLNWRMFSDEICVLFVLWVFLFAQTFSFLHADVKQLIAQNTPRYESSENCYEAKIRISLEAILGPQLLVTGFGLYRWNSIQLLCHGYWGCVSGNKAAGSWS